MAQAEGLAAPREQHGEDDDGHEATDPRRRLSHCRRWCFPSVAFVLRSCREVVLFGALDVVATFGTHRNACGVFSCFSNHIFGLSLLMIAGLRILRR